MRTQPKKNITNVRLKDKEYGLPLRKEYAKVILENAPIFPKPLGYDDIDNEMYHFANETIKLTINGKNIPTFTLYSNQRFSEYSQTWQYTDDDGNLLMNFKTINRENNPKPGDNQGGLWNIPGERNYTLLTRTVLGDNGKEHYEIYSMKQPYCVDLMYRINFVTNKFEYINNFNIIINDIFKSRQHYIRPNGHYIPIIVDEINDETEYSVGDRKFYAQSIVLKVMAYIINESDFKVEKKPKYASLFIEGDTNRPKPTINIDENDDSIENVSINMTIDFDEWHDKVEFTMEGDMVVDTVSLFNLRSMRLFRNGTMIYTDKGFKLKDKDDIKIKVIHFDIKEKAKIVFSGYDPNVNFNNKETPEFVSDEPLKHEEIIID